MVKGERQDVRSEWRFLGNCFPNMIPTKMKKSVLPVDDGRLLVRWDVSTAAVSRCFFFHVPLW